ncbi:MAG TPA: surface-adhesin E family protein [Steroidobacteraceae bacterium]|jgi:hypothetical protein|nr:surface-adhesin E family protein [Steroidobacteraceae bacterium]
MHKTILLVLLLACGTAQASQWVFVLKSADGKQNSYVDVTSVRSAGVIHRAWEKTVYKPHSYNGEGAPPRKWWHDSVNLFAFNCNEETVRSESITVYYEDGTHETESATTVWEPVPPDTMLSAVMQVVCALKPK